MSSANTKQVLYADDLAEIHVDGYGFHWEGAAPGLLKLLREHGIQHGRLVDLGCGGGQWCATAEGAGYQTVGIDVSAAMIKIAKRNSPRTDFRCECFSKAKIPECDIVTSLGEPLNYLNSERRMRRTLRNVFRALRSDGLFIFDVRQPPRGAVDPIHHVKSDDDWFCYALIEEDANSLKRSITTFRRVGQRFRRDEEIHRLKLFSKKQTLEWLREIGFRVRTYDGYGDYKLGKRQAVFVCRKP